MVFLKSDCKRIPYRHWQWPCLQDRFRKSNFGIVSVGLLWVVHLDPFCFAWSAAIRNLRNDDGNDHDNAANQWFDWLNEEKNRAARAIWCNFLTWSTKRRREILIFEVLTTTRARSSKSLILCFCIKTIRAKQAKVHFAYFVHRDHLGIVAKHLTNAKFYFNVTFSLQ